MIRSEAVVCVCAALVLGAIARSPSVNEVLKFDDKESNERTKVYNYENPYDVQVGPEAQEVRKSIIERFPSAVLFGRTCGGTILSEKWVLSAAHCTIFSAGRSVLAGTENSSDGSGVERRIKKLHVHPLFTVGPYWLNARHYNISQVAAAWDYLLAELVEPLPLNNSTIKAAKLADIDVEPAGTPVGFAGYGAEHHGETMRHEMHAMRLETLSNEQCSKLEQFNAASMLCARGAPPYYDTACNGDSGSGLVKEDNTLIGVASWVENDALWCRNNSMVVFSKVAAARPWIREITGL